MNLSWRQFGTYLDAFTWLLREESEEGQKENRKDDHKAKGNRPDLASAKLSLIEETKKAVEKHKRFAMTNPEGGTTKSLLAVN